jgi:hypothetical protein
MVLCKNLQSLVAETLTLHPCGKAMLEPAANKIRVHTLYETPYDSSLHAIDEITEFDVDSRQRARSMSRHLLGQLKHLTEMRRRIGVRVPPLRQQRLTLEAWHSAKPFRR